MRAASDGDEAPHRATRLFWAGMAVGGAVMAFGVRGLVSHRAGVMPTNPPRWALLALGVNVVHDLVVVPVVLVAGLIVARLVPASVRALVQAGLISSAMVTLYALPLVLRLGAEPANPTILPRDYRWGLGVLLVGIWAVVAVLAVVARRRRRATS